MRRRGAETVLPLHRLQSAGFPLLELTAILASAHKASAPMPNAHSPSIFFAQDHGPVPTATGPLSAFKLPNPESGNNDGGRDSFRASVGTQDGHGRSMKGSIDRDASYHGPPDFWNDDEIH